MNITEKMLKKLFKDSTNIVMPMPGALNTASTHYVKNYLKKYPIYSFQTEVKSDCESFLRESKNIDYTRCDIEVLDIDRTALVRVYYKASKKTDLMYLPIQCIKFL